MVNARGGGDAEVRSTMDASPSAPSEQVAYSLPQPVRQKSIIAHRDNRCAIRIGGEQPGQRNRWVGLLGILPVRCPKDLGQ